MSPKTLQQQEEIRQKSKKKIADAALFLFAQKGYYSTTISDIANHAKVSKGLMYNYFKSKEELLDEIVGKMLEIPLSSENVFGKINDPREALEMIVEKIEKETADNLYHWKLQTTLFLQPGIMEKYSQKLDEVTKYMEGEIHHLFEKAGSQNPKLDTALFLSGIEGIQLFHIYKPNIISPKETRKHLLEKIFNDIKTNKNNEIKQV